MKPFPALLAAAVVLTGCAGVGAGGGAGPSFPPPAPRSVDPGARTVLQVQQLGGMVVSWSLPTRLEDPSVYADGRVIREVEQPVPVDQLPALEAMAWPGPALPGQDVDLQGTRCTVVDGADLAPVLEAAGQARLKTPWSDGGRTWDLRRPLLPDEDSCEDLAAPAGS